MSSFKWHLNPHQGLSQKQTVNSTAERYVESCEQLYSNSYLKFKPTN